MKPIGLQVGIFKQTKLITTIGSRVYFDDTTRQAVTAAVEMLCAELDKHYQPIDGEYVAFDYVFPAVTQPN